MAKQISDKVYIASLLVPVSQVAHKGTQGHTLLIGGSMGKAGSVCLASYASLKAGCGLTTAFVPRCANHIIQGYVPEVMAITDKKRKYISHITYDLTIQSAGIGPGLGMHEATQAAMLHFLSTCSTPLVIDADALNILAGNRQGLTFLKEGDILTPHSKELERLVGRWRSTEEMLDLAVAFSLRHQVIIVAKGAPTMIIDGTKIYQNTTGNAGLATAGSGDVLTGILSGLRAQGLSPLNTALCGTYIHGLAADIGVLQTGVRSFMASDIIRFLGAAFLQVEAVRSQR